MMLSELIQEFLEYERVQVLLGNHSPLTRRAYRLDLDHLSEALGDMPLTAIDAKTVQNYYLALATYNSERTGKPLSPHTINKYLRTFRRLLKFAVARDWLENPPAIETIRADVDLEEKTIPVEDLQKILERAQSKGYNRERDTFIVVALSDFGPRVSEIATLTIPNVDIENKQVTIRRKGGKTQTLPVSDVFLGLFTNG